MSAEIPKAESDGQNSVQEANDDGGDVHTRSEREEALVALIEHRTKEIHHFRERISYYKSQLNVAENSLNETQIKLDRLRGMSSSTTSKSSHEKKSKSNESLSPASCSQNTKNLSASKEPSSRPQPLAKPHLQTPPVKPKVGQPTKSMTESSARKLSVKEVGGVRSKGTKRKFEQKESEDRISSIRTTSSPSTIRCHSTAISSQHKRKLRSLELCPTSEQLFVTSALDGVVNLWQIQSTGFSANLLSTTDCLSAKHRKWPEDIAWHPEGGSIFSVYSAEKGESQVSILNLSRTKDKARVRFLEGKPHVRGIINNIVFMPWEDELCFMTGGSDHAVVSWVEDNKDDVLWAPKALHRSIHTSAVTGVAGLHHKKTVMSAGADKKVVGFDLVAGRAEYTHQIDSKCMSVLPNPRDFNLVLVQSGTMEKQLRLLDLRVRHREVHAFGWKQESTESQSALICQAWSPDGWLISSGSVDPVVHVFDIRSNSHKPSQSIRAHQKRVFKAAWHHSLPLLISISSDLNIGLHKVA